MAQYVGFRVEDIQKVVDWMSKKPLPYEETHELLAILLHGNAYSPDIMIVNVGPDPVGMT